MFMRRMLAFYSCEGRKGGGRMRERAKEGEREYDMHIYIYCFLKLKAQSVFIFIQALTIRIYPANSQLITSNPVRILHRFGTWQGPSRWFCRSLNDSP